VWADSGAAYLARINELDDVRKASLSKLEVLS
jgi:hypothetical protein